MVVNKGTVVTFVRVSTTADAATTADLPILPDSMLVIGKPMPQAGATNITVAAINASATAGVLYVTGVDVVGT